MIFYFLALLRYLFYFIFSRLLKQIQESAAFFLFGGLALLECSFLLVFECNWM